MRTALLALALSPTLAVVPCSSDKPDDVDTEGCYGHESDHRVEALAR